MMDEEDAFGFEGVSESAGVTPNGQWHAAYPQQECEEQEMSLRSRKYEQRLSDMKARARSR